MGKGPRASEGGARGPGGPRAASPCTSCLLAGRQASNRLAAAGGVRHSSRVAVRSQYLVVPALLFAAAALLSEPASAAEPTCDKRVLPRADTLSVEAAARAATGDKPEDIHVSEACITGTTTSVTLTTPRGAMICERLQSTWYKRGGWKCDTPRSRAG